MTTSPLEIAQRKSVLAAQQYDPEGYIMARALVEIDKVTASPGRFVTRAEALNIIARVRSKLCWPSDAAILDGSVAAEEADFAALAKHYREKVRPDFGQRTVRPLDGSVAAEETTT